MEEESIISLTFDFINSLTVTIYFQNPIKDFALPIRNLRTWFPKESAMNKRAEIAGVIRELAAKQHPKKTFDMSGTTPSSSSSTASCSTATSTPASRAKERFEFYYNYYLFNYILSSESPVKLVLTEAQQV